MTLEEAVKKDLNTALSELVQQAFWTGYKAATDKIVHCKDCKFVGTDATCCLVCDREGMGLRPFHVYHDDYCSYAERKEE